MKFGGTSLDNGEMIKHVAKLIKNLVLKRNNLIVVVSAMADVTDRLIEATENAVKSDQKTVRDFVETLSELQMDAAKRCIHSKALLKRVLVEIDKLSKDIEKVLMSISYLREVTPRSKDYILSFGEKFSAAILCTALEDLGLKAKSFTGGDAGIVTDNRFGEARPLMKVTALQVKTRLEPVLEQGVIPVIAGFIAFTQDGITTTLGRGSSDYTATILGASLEMDEVWIWTDTDGLMTADPKVEPLAKTIPLLSYAEATEMAYFGAKAMHPQALEPAIENSIPVRIKNTLKPDKECTLIVSEKSIGKENVAKSIAIIKGVALVTVSGAFMIGAPGVAAKVFGILGENKINVLMISQSSSQANMSFIVKREELALCVNTLELSLLGQGIAKEITSEDDVCIIAIVGAGMKGTPGVAARIFSAIAEEGINVRMIAQGSSELNISFVIKEEKGILAVRKLHKEFQLG